MEAELTEIDDSALTPLGRLVYGLLFAIQFGESAFGILIGMFSGREAAWVSFSLFCGGAALAVLSLVGLVTAVTGAFARPLLVASTCLSVVVFATLTTVV